MEETIGIAILSFDHLFEYARVVRQVTSTNLLISLNAAFSEGHNVTDVTAELIRRTTFTATEQELKQRIEALRSAGWSQLVIPITPGEERAIEDWARIKRAFD